MAKTVADLLVRIGANTDDLRKQLNATKRQLNSAFGSGAVEFAEDVARGAAAAGVALAGLGAYAVKLSGNFQNVQAAMTNMLGSTEKANAFLADLQKFAANTPFDFQGLATASQRLLAFGFQAEQILPTMQAIGDAAAALGKGQEGIDQITLSLGQMAAKGRVQADEMLQLTEAGIPAWRLLAETIGTSIPEAMDQVSRGQVTAQQGLEAIINGMESQFGGLMERQSQTISGSWSNLMDGLEQSAVAAGLKISDALDLPDLFGSLGDSFQQFAQDINTYGITEALHNLIPPEAEIAAVALAGALTGLLAVGLASIAVTAATVLAPFAAFIAAMSAAGVVVGILVDPMGILPGILELFGMSSYDAEAAVRALCDAVSSAVEWAASLADAIPSLADQFPVLTGAINAAANALANLINLESSYQGLTSKDKRVKDYQDALAGKNGLRVLDYDENTHTFSDPKRKKLDFSNFASTKPATSVGGGAGGASGSGSGSGVNKLEAEADRVSKSISDAYNRTFATAEENAKYWYEDQLDKLNKSKSANENYNDDLTNLNAVYEQKRRKAAADEANEQIRLYDKVHSAAESSMQLRNVYGSATKQGEQSMVMDYLKSVESIRKRWQQMEVDYLGMTDRERKALLEQLDAQGLAYEVYEDGRLSLASETAADIAAANKAYLDKQTEYYRNAKDIQADIDEAFAKNSMSLLKASLTAENAARLAAVNEQKDAMNAFYENWQEINQTANDKLIGTVQDSKDTFNNFFSDVLTGSQSFLESLTDLFSGVWENIVSNFTSSWGASISNSLLGMFGIGQTDTEGGGFSGMTSMGEESPTDALTGFMEALTGSTSALTSNSGALGTATGALGLFNGITNTGSGLLSKYNAIQSLINTATKPKETVTTVGATAALSAFTPAVITATAALQAMSAAGGFFGGLFAEGGAIRGPGSGTSDSIPARLSNGEYVINAKAAKKWGLPLLNALNAGKMPAFASGGPVNIKPTFSTSRMPSLERALSAMVSGGTRNVSVNQNIYGDITSGADEESMFDALNAIVEEGMRA